MSIIEFIPGFSRRNAGGVLLFQTRFAFLQLMQERAVLFKLFALIGDDLFRRAGDELLVRKLALEHGDLPQAVFLFLCDAGQLLFHVDEL